ncbi:MAG: glycerophosphodiester phosphodiesterase family protein [Bacteroidales bacterium]|nr:glycerophosphodiester phosphodiesterase family protein [Bacteroidales bacterium]
MKRTALIIIALSLCCAAMAQSRVDSIRMRLLDPSDRTVLVAAHRGEWKNAPQNSLQSILDAAEEGVDIAEIDVRRTRDGVLVLMHNPTLSGTTTGWGFVRLVSLRKLRTFRLKDSEGRVTDMQVPTLEEALLAAKGRIMLNLDKAFDYFPQIMQLARKTGTLDHIIVKSSKSPEDVLRIMGADRDSVIFMPIFHLDKPEETKLMQYSLAAFSPCAVEVNFRDSGLITPYLIKTSLEGKTRIWYNDLGHHAAGFDAGQLVESFGATIIQSDSCAELIEMLKEKGYR